MKKLLALGATGAIAFGIVGAAATSLTVTQDRTPAQGNGTEAVCSADVAVTYTYSGSDVTAIVLTADDATCNAFTPTLSSVGGTIPVGTMGANGTPTNGWTYTLTAAEAITTFDPGNIYVTFK